MTKLFQRKKNNPSYKGEISKEYEELVERLSAIRSNFEFAVSEKEIDALIYEENAVISRLSALYQKAKENNIRLFPYEITDDKEDV